MLSHHFRIGGVHLLKIRHFLQKDVDVEHMLEIRADTLEHDCERLQYLPRLSLNVISCQLSSSRIYPGCSPDNNMLAYLCYMAVWTNWRRRVGRRERLNSRLHNDSP